MKKPGLILVLVWLSVVVGQKVVFSQEAEWEDIGDGYRNVQAVLVDKEKPQYLYLGSEEGILRSIDAGKSWSNVLSLNGNNRQVRALAYQPKDKFAIYAATANGLFFSSDQAKTWRRIFQGRSFQEKDCRALAVSDDYIYLGTGAGLFVSADRGKSWKKQLNALGYSRILAIALNQNDRRTVYVASVEGLFKTQNSSQSWEKVFIGFATDNDPGNGEDRDETEGEENRSSIIRSVAVELEKSDHVYLATGNGVLESKDNGKSWKKVPDQGLLEKDVTGIYASPGSRLYCSTRTGIFSFQSDHWQNLSVRLIPGEINGLSGDNFGNLYAACNKGLFKAGIAGGDNAQDKEEKARKDFLKDGPDITEVQQAAMRYAEVEPEKIRNWRKLAAKKAWLPSMNLGLNRETTDLWHWESGSTTKECDDSLRKGHDSVGWDISFNWDLGDIIWSDDQNSIDVRSRLTVQLRNDILDEVTKLYFERIRVKRELEKLDILERKKREEKELRVRELSAYLDGLTGGFFTSRMKD
jgi:photosystem II stability/assembly factor-like uncharacterized protein